MAPIKRTFLIDDDEIFKFAMKRLIEIRGLSETINSFDTVADALTYLVTHKEQVDELPDLILIDINLKTETGWEFMEHYQSLKSTLAKQPQIFILSSSVSPLDAAEAAKYPDIRACLNKPLSKEHWALVFGHHDE